MRCEPKVHSPKSAGLPNHDCSSAGFYFVTLCTYKRRCLFGDAVDGELQLSKFGAHVESAWREIPRCHNNVRLDAFVIMPNHLHGIISLDSATDDFDNERAVSADREAMDRLPTVREIVHAFKARCAFYLEANGCLEKNGLDAAPVWQRRFHEHIIADEKAYRDIVQYIEKDLQQWQRDIYNIPHRSTVSRVPFASRSGELPRVSCG